MPTAEQLRPRTQFVYGYDTARVLAHGIRARGGSAVIDELVDEPNRYKVMWTPVRASHRARAHHRRVTKSERIVVLEREVEHYEQRADEEEDAGNTRMAKQLQDMASDARNEIDRLEND
jgi:hypothetical protein